MNWIMRKGSLLSFKQGLHQFKSEREEGKEISNSLFFSFLHTSQQGEKEFIFIAEAICAANTEIERFTRKRWENIILTCLQLNFEADMG